MSRNLKLEFAAKVYRDAEAVAPTTTYCNGVKAISFTKAQRQQIIAALYQVDNSFESATTYLRDILVEQDEKAGQVRLTSYQRHTARLRVMQAQFARGKLRGNIYNETPLSRPVATAKTLHQLKDKAVTFTPVQLVTRGLEMGVTNVDAYLELQRPIFDSLLQEARKDQAADMVQGDILALLQNSPYTGKLDKARIQAAATKAIAQLVK